MPGRFACALAALLLCACGGSTRVTFDHSQCLLDGRPATHEEVEAAQSQLAERIMARQPLYVAVTLVVLLLAGASQIEKLWLILAARREPRVGIADRLRALLERYRAHPLRYFAIVGATLVLLLLAGGVYLWLDAEKRASERALGQLQFCHLSLEAAEEQAKLDEQRKNVESLRTTVGDIKSLVDTLPPDQQRKAATILGQVRLSVTNQDRLLAKSNAVAAAVQARTAELQKQLIGLQKLPDDLRRVGDDVKKLDDAVRKADARAQAGMSGLDQRIGQLAGRSCAAEKLPSGKTVGEALGELLARPVPTCPPCRCEAAPPRAARDGGG